MLLGFSIGPTCRRWQRPSSHANHMKRTAAAAKHRPPPHSPNHTQSTHFHTPQSAATSVQGSPPLVFAGGPTATSNPEPFSDFLDFVALGDGEDLLPEIARCLRAAKASRLSRLDTLRSLTATVAGVYVPQLYSAAGGGAVTPVDPAAPPRILRRVAAPLVQAQVGLVPFVETIHDRMTVEIRRGCTRGCRFCQPGMLTRPARDVDPDVVVDTVEQGIRTTGYNEFSLLSLSCSDYLSLPSVGLQVRGLLRAACSALRCSASSCVRLWPEIVWRGSLVWLSAVHQICARTALIQVRG